MPSGLVALLDDVAVIARTAAASVDDIAAAAGRAGSKTAGVVIDDAAVIASDFRIDPAGHIRFAVIARPTAGARRICGPSAPVWARRPGGLSRR
jgi:hypothetical protein